MAAKSASKQQPPPLPPEKPAGYQPTLRRKLFMMALCIIGLIVVWTYYFTHGGKL
ncbi:MAG TPA: hypothetical protein VMH80_02735 [Bryobacteraceae bacterium]|nr:hypothetical protein [Bryobacteraceae bacterium]